MIGAIRELLPEAELIGDGDLKEKVLSVWVKTMELGGWKPEDLDRIPFTLLIEDVEVSFLAHTKGVTMVAAAAATVFETVYGDTMPLNRDYLIAGALLHDIGKLLEYREVDGKFVKSHMGKYVRHPFSGVGIAFDMGIPPEVLHCIAIHSKENAGGKRSPEACLIHHADFMNFEPLHEPLV